MKKGRIIAAGGLVLGLATTGTAWALWSVDGGVVSTGTASEARLEATATPVSDLYPGGYRPVTVTVRNPNTYPVQFGNIFVRGLAVDPEHSACPPHVVVADASTSSYSTVLGPLNEQQFEVGVGLEPTAPEACKGARFEIEYHARGSVGTAGF